MLNLDDQQGMQKSGIEMSVLLLKIWSLLCMLVGVEQDV